MNKQLMGTAVILNGATCPKVLLTIQKQGCRVKNISSEDYHHLPFYMAGWIIFSR